MQILGSHVVLLHVQLNGVNKKNLLQFSNMLNSNRILTTTYTLASLAFFISEDHPFLRASPDAVIYDPSDAESFGLGEVKCPYSCRNLLPSEASSQTNFCSLMVLDANSQPKLQLKSHSYYSQIQAQLAISK